MFGLSAEEVAELQKQGYDPYAYYEANPELRAVIDLVRDGFVCRGDTALFKPLIESLLHWDTYMVLADYQSYADCERRVSRAYQGAQSWTAMSILNTARSGTFSSDRTSAEYAEDIWRVRQTPVKLLSQHESTFRVPR